MQEPAVWAGSDGGAYLCATWCQFGHLSGARGFGFEMAHSPDWQVACLLPLVKNYCQMSFFPDSSLLEGGRRA